MRRPGGAEAIDGATTCRRGRGRRRTIEGRIARARACTRARDAPGNGVTSVTASRARRRRRRGPRRRRGERRGAEAGDSSAAAQRPRRRTYSNPHWSHRRTTRSRAARRGRATGPGTRRGRGASSGAQAREKSLRRPRRKTDSGLRRGRAAGREEGRGSGSGRGGAAGARAGSGVGGASLRGRVLGGPRGDSAPADPRRGTTPRREAGPIARGAGRLERRARLLLAALERLPPRALLRGAPAERLRDEHGAPARVVPHPARRASARRTRPRAARYISHY